jgi:hypothetical protein
MKYCHRCGSSGMRFNAYQLKAFATSDSDWVDSGADSDDFEFLYIRIDDAPDGIQCAIRTRFARKSCTDSCRLRSIRTLFDT